MGHGEVEVTVISLNKPQKYKALQKAKNWFILRNKVLAQIIGAIAFFIIFGYVIYDVLRDSNDTSIDCPNGVTPPKTSFSFRSSNDSSSCYWTETCTIYCSGSFQSINTVLNEDLSCLTNLSLTLSGIEFRQNHLNANWFESIAQIQCLNIIDSPTLNVIDAGAFDASSFSTIKQLKLHNLNVSHLRAATFQGLHALENLHLAGMPLKCIDALLLDAMPRLAALSMEEMPFTIDLKNLTGSSKLQRLQIVSLRQNQLQNTISSVTFTSLEAVVSLYLSDSQIEWIGAGAFDSISHTVQTIDLQGNPIKTLPNGIFDKLTITYGWSILLGRNEWQCNCSLIQLQQYLQNFAQHFEGIVTCSDPHYGEPVSTTELGDCNRTAITSSNTITIRNVSCGYMNNAPLSTAFVRVRSNVHRLKIATTPNHEYLSLSIDTEDAMTLNLIWFEHDSDNISVIPTNAYCLPNMTTSSPMQIHNLTAKRAYIFCLIEENALTVSPFDCVPYYVSFADAKPNSSRLPSMLMTFVSAPVAMLMGLFIGICLHKKFCNNKIVTETHRTPPPYNSPRSIGMCRHTLYSNFRITRPVYHRSISDTSVYSVPSYVTAIRPTAQDLVQWRKTNHFRGDALEMDQWPVNGPPSPTLPPYNLDTRANAAVRRDCNLHGCPHDVNVPRMTNCRTTILRQDNVSDSSS